MVLGSWPTTMAPADTTAMSKTWAQSCIGAHLEPWTTPRSTIVKIRFDSETAMRRNPFVIARAFLQESGMQLRKVWVAPEGPQSQAFRRRMARRSGEGHPVGPERPECPPRRPAWRNHVGQQNRPGGERRGLHHPGPRLRHVPRVEGALLDRHECAEEGVKAGRGGQPRPPRPSC